MLDENLQRQIDDDETFSHRYLKKTTQSGICRSVFVLTWVDVRHVDESTLLAWLITELSVVVEFDAGLRNSVDERADIAHTDTCTMREVAVSDQRDRPAVAD